MVFQPRRSLVYLGAFVSAALLVVSLLTMFGASVDAAAPPTPTPAAARTKPTDASPIGGSWTRVSPLPTDRNLYAVDFADDQNGWAVGQDGAILKTTDETNWSAVSSGITDTLRSVKFAGRQNGWAVGGRGAVLKSSDGGGNWTAQASGTSRDLLSVDFVDGQTGWAVGDGGAILKTVNAGETWAWQATGTNQNLRSMLMTDAQTGWALGDGGSIIRTTDGGTHWVQPESGPTGIKVLSFADARNGLAAGDNGKIVKTTDGGVTWTAQNSGTTASFSTLSFVDTQHAFTALRNQFTAGDTIWKTADGGFTWAQSGTITTTLDGSVYGGSLDRFLDAQNGWALGSLDGANATSMYSSADAGATWSFHGTSLGGLVNASASFVDGATGWIASGYGLMKTTDGGVTWIHLTGDARSKTSLQFFDSQRGWAESRGKLLTTADGGVTWQEQIVTADPPGGSVSGYFFLNSQTGWAFVSWPSWSRLYGTTDGGVTWTFVSQDVIYGTPFFTDASNGWLNAGNGIASTTDGGKNWTRTSWAPANSGMYSRSILVVDSQTLWALGVDGPVLKTTNGGATWNNVAGLGSASVRDLYFINPQTGWAVGPNGSIQKTADGGQTWTAQPSGTTDYLTSVRFLDSSTGWVIGGSDSGGRTILKTTDGGVTWTPTTTGKAESLRSLVFSGAQTGWAVGTGGTVLKTTDGGRIWTPQRSGITSTLTMASFADTQNGWAGGPDGTVIKTADGGTTWGRLSPPLPSPPSWYGVDRMGTITLVDAQTGWVAGHDGAILKTTDGGRTWTVQTQGTSTNLTAVHFLDTTTGWAVSALNFLKTDDGGASWRRSNLPPSSISLDFVDGYFVDEQKGWAIGGPYIFKTVDGGAIWTEQEHWMHTFVDIHFVDRDHGYVLARDGVMAVTSDGGQTWGRYGGVISDEYNGRLTSFHFTDPQTFTSVGEHGAISRTSMATGRTQPEYRGTLADLLFTKFVDSNTGWALADASDASGPATAVRKTTDGGATWSAPAEGSGSALSLDFVDGQTGWGVGYSGSIVKTADGGVTWVGQTSPVTSILNSVDFVDSRNGWAVGDNEAIIGTTDGGTTWTQLAYRLPDARFYAVSPSSFKSVRFLDSQRGWIAGTNGNILRTTDGGRTWLTWTAPPGTAGPGGAFSSIGFADALTGWAVGRGVVVVTTDGGVTWTPQTIPQAYSGIDSSNTNLNSLAVVDSQTAWAAGQSPGLGNVLIYTKNGGVSWSILPSFNNAELTSVSFPDSGTGWAVGQWGTVLKFGISYPPRSYVPVATRGQSSGW